MEKSKEKNFSAQVKSNKILQRTGTYPSSPLKNITTSLNSKQMNYIKAQNHAIKGNVISNPSTVQQICNVLSNIKQNHLEIGPKCFQVSTFNNMQRRQSQKLLHWLKSKLASLDYTKQISMQQFIQYRQSIVNIVLASVMEMVGTICKQLAQTLGCLWIETFSVLQKIIDYSAKKHAQKDLIISVQQNQLEKQQGIFVEKITQIQLSQTQNLSKLKQSFKDTIINNRQLSKEIARLNKDLQGEQIKILNMEEALIRSIDITINNSHGDDQKWARAVMSSIFKSKKKDENTQGKQKHTNKMLKYEEYAKYKVQQTIVNHMKTTKKYQYYSSDEIINDFLRVPAMDLIDISMSGLFLTTPKVDQQNKISYDFTIQDICKKPLKTIFENYKSVAAQTQTDHPRYFSDQQVQTFTFTNLINRQVQTSKIYSTDSQVQTQSGARRSSIKVKQKQNLLSPQQEQESFKIRVYAPRKSSFLPKNFIKSQNSFTKIPLSQQPSQSIILEQDFYNRNNYSYNKQFSQRQDKYQKDDKKSSFKYNRPPISQDEPRNSTKLKQTINKIIRSSKVIKSFRKSSLNPMSKSNNISNASKIDTTIADFQKTQMLLQNTFSGFHPNQINKKIQKLVPYVMQQNISISEDNGSKQIEILQKQDQKRTLRLSNQQMMSSIMNLGHNYQSQKSNQSVQLVNGYNFIIQKNKQMTYCQELDTNNKIWENSLKLAKLETVQIKNISQKVLSFNRLFATLFSQIVKNTIFQNKLIDDSISKKYISSNLDTKFILKPLKSLRHFVVGRISNQNKKKVSQSSKTLKTMINELIVLSQTKQIQIFIDLMGLNDSKMDSTQLQILVRLFYFFNPSKPYGFSVDLKISCFSQLTQHLSFIVDELLPSTTISEILKLFSERQCKSRPIFIIEVWKQLCHHIKILKEQEYSKFDYLKKILGDYISLQDIIFLMKGVNLKVIVPQIINKFNKFADCLNKNNQRCISEQKLWRLGYQCKLPDQISFKKCLQTKSSFSLYSKVKNVIIPLYRQIFKFTKKQYSIQRIISSFQRSDHKHAEQKSICTRILYNGLIQQIVNESIGSPLQILSETLSTK